MKKIFGPGGWRPIVALQEVTEYAARSIEYELKGVGILLIYKSSESKHEHSFGEAILYRPAAYYESFETTLSSEDESFFEKHPEQKGRIQILKIRDRFSDVFKIINVHLCKDSQDHDLKPIIDDIFTSLKAKHIPEYTNTYILGDFNYDMNTWSNGKSLVNGVGGMNPPNTKNNPKAYQPQAICLA